MRFIVKIGSNLLTQEDNALNVAFIEHVAAQISILHAQGHEPLIVTSGAVAAGRRTISLKKESKNIPYRQLLAAVGQTFLMDTYRDSFNRYGMIIGQVLLTMHDLDRRKSFLITRNTLDLMLKHRIVPIVNENDVTTFAGLKFGDNDNLSARLSSTVDAETLILLTDVDGLFDANPTANPQARLIDEVEAITPQIKAMAQGKGTKKSLGGMRSKIEAAEYATQAGVDVWIANGSTAHVITEIIHGERPHGTHFRRQFIPKDARHKWMQSQQNSQAAIVVDSGACDAILNKGKSLLPSGIQKVKGIFQRGDIIGVLNEEEVKMGFGQVNYSSEELALIKGKKSNEIEEILGYMLQEEVIHRDNMVK
ncbi:MAG: hypothetical protein ACD_28C00287G0003 [uncultured bacterium]|nr:MAG: hypothetical protein ACD_28C00287G0003 [uncultured bacterium]KKT74205.1 MAG: Glutamate 5-kinase [Candidatus Peregrinibacteria bacterium GW2011_GWA2_44_7]